MNLSLLQRAISRHLRVKNTLPYQQLLQSISSSGDIWLASQGQVIDWWQRRHRASMVISAADGKITVTSDLADAVFERYPQEFLDSGGTTSSDSPFSGQVQLVIDTSLERRHLLIEALCREGIMNFALGGEGEFFLSHELDGVLERMAGHLRREELQEYSRTILEIRDAVAMRLAEQGLPLIRIWYHPRIGGQVMRAAFSARFDVERAIILMPRIRQLEQRYGAQSTAHVRVFCPFYTDEEIRELQSSAVGLDIALHAEFAAHGRRFGDEQAAASASKSHLEEVLGQPVAGVSFHGGELVSSYSPAFWTVLESCDFDWASTSRRPYYLPCRRLDSQDQLLPTFILFYQLMDLTLPIDNYGAAFRQSAAQGMHDALAHNGIFSVVLHPEYFGFLSYLLHPKSLVRFLRFIPTYLRRIIKLEEGQRKLEATEL